MNISNIVTASGHQKSIISSLKSANGLPFRDILSPEVIAECINVPYRTLSMVVGCATCNHDIKLNTL